MGFITYDNDLLVYEHYIGFVQINGAINSILRDDNVPSFSIFESYNGSLRWADHATGESGNAVELIKIIEDVEGKEAIKIYKDICGGGRASSAKRNVVRKSSKDPTLVLRSFFRHSESAYYSKFGIDNGSLIVQHTFPLVELKYDSNVAFSSTDDEPKFIFLYPFQDTSAWKMYNPLAANREDKWRSGNISNVLDNWHRLPPKMDKLRTFTSRKDGQTYEAHTKDICWIAPPSESNFNPILKRLDEIKSRSKEQIIMNDLDDRGKALAAKLSDATNFAVNDYHTNPLEYKGKIIKDISEIREHLGVKSLMNYLGIKILSI